jgi:chromosome segregation ATPase
MTSKKPNSTTTTSTTRRSKKDADEGELSLQDQNTFLQREVEALKLQLIRESNKSTQAELVVKELRTKLHDLQQAHAAEKQRSLDISLDSNRQYKSMREELIRKITQLQDEITVLLDKIERQRLEAEDQQRRNAAALQLKQTEIDEQKQRMDEMAQEFGAMLKQTLDKMSEKIEITNEWDNNADDNTAPVVRTFEEFNLGLGTTS